MISIADSNQISLKIINSLYLTQCSKMQGEQKNLKIQWGNMLKQRNTNCSHDAVSICMHWNG